jgi:phage FluMu gp28-like protein
MNFSSFFGIRRNLGQPRIASDAQTPEPRIASDSLGDSTPGSEPIRTSPNLSEAIRPEIVFPWDRWALPTQAAYLDDPAPLRIVQKGRQVGLTTTDALDTVLKVSPAGARHDVYVTTRDEVQARLYAEDVLRWARILHLAAVSLGMLVLDPRTNASAYTIEFANGRRVYCLSSNPNALAGKRGHVKIDEFALHQDQRTLYHVAKPVTTWGGTLSIISTHRGPDTVFNQIIQDILHKGNPMGWHLYTYSIQKAVEEGIVDRINEKSGRNETGDQFLARIRSECLDEEQWLQEYCCQPSDQNSAFLTYEMLSACEDRHLRLMSFSELLEHLRSSNHPLYLGVDVARIHNLCVLYLGERIGDVMWDRCRIELQNKTYAEIEFELYRLLALPQLKRACIDATGLGNQLAERARERFGYKVEPVMFTAQVKEELAFKLRADFEDRKLRIVADDNLRTDLRGLKKEVTPSGNIRFTGETDDSHCDRTWALALRQHASRYRMSAGGAVA